MTCTPRLPATLMPSRLVSPTVLGSILFLLAPAPRLAAATIADSVDGWSNDGTQGEGGWFNGYYNLSQDLDASYEVDDFIEFLNDGSDTISDTNQWTGVEWVLSDDPDPTGGPWTYIGMEESHPNGTNSTPNEEHWTIRRWTSDRTGRLALSWHMRKVDPNDGGVTGYLFLDGREIDRATIVGGDTIGVKRTVVADVEAGDSIDLALGPAGFCGDDSDGFDESFNILSISETLPPPDSTEEFADAQADWSADGEQFENHWGYGYYDQRLDVEEGDGRYSTGEFIEFLSDGSNVVSDTNHWNGEYWDLMDNNILSAGPWVELSCATGHPSGNGQTDDSVHWAVRRLLSEVPGRIEISGVFWNAGEGDGVVGRIFNNGTEIFSAVSNGNVVHFSVETVVTAGDHIDFAIDADGAGNLELFGIDSVDDGFDETAFTATIRRLPGSGPPFIRGDADQNGVLQIGDPVQSAFYLFLGLSTVLPNCLDSADSDNNGAIQLTDALRVLGYLFLGGPPPASPFPDCGTDPDDGDDLGCLSYEGCP